MKKADGRMLLVRKLVGPINACLRHHQQQVLQTFVLSVAHLCSFFDHEHSQRGLIAQFKNQVVLINKFSGLRCSF